ncbi:Ribosomal protein L36 family protein (apicoplast) [Theileria parva strain Muguga]|uniref:Large ribosomal subunit protein bL36c n=1 Tax=Theileria parva TaxID=5875 RepID=RK36_THEPA|nr:RecName: Full=Large ribosomal subunit protein bL36c; AltName: Full=50S ribosomal protein L36, apicoplast [Theileria parva]EAN30401.1 Ribosomal protein L36 family protein [Theileria parva strain Muguga]|eukprot:XP_762684.1 ribosomal protein L36 (apicoplast) [Theileria parva strain Muguga]
MKTKTSIKQICNLCKIVRRNKRLVNTCKLHKNHKHKQK